MVDPNPGQNDTEKVATGSVSETARPKNGGCVQKRLKSAKLSKTGPV